MSAKLATLGFLKINVFQNKCYDVIIYICDVTNKILLCDSNYIVFVEFGDSMEHFYDRSYHNLNLIGIAPRKPSILSSAFGSSSIIWD